MTANAISKLPLKLKVHRHRIRGGRRDHGLPNIGNLSHPLSITTPYLVHACCKSLYCEKRKQSIAARMSLLMITTKKVMLRSLKLTLTKLHPWPLPSIMLPQFLDASYATEVNITKSSGCLYTYKCVCVCVMAPCNSSTWFEFACICDGCTKDDCGNCKYCLDMPRFSDPRKKKRDVWVANAQCSLDSI